MTGYMMWFSWIVSVVPSGKTNDETVDMFIALDRQLTHEKRMTIYEMFH